MNKYKTNNVFLKLIHSNTEWHVHYELKHHYLLRKKNKQKKNINNNNNTIYISAISGIRKRVSTTNHKFDENHLIIHGNTCSIYCVGIYFLAMPGISIVQNIGQI